LKEFRGWPNIKNDPEDSESIKEVVEGSFFEVFLEFRSFPKSPSRTNEIPQDFRMQCYGMLWVETALLYLGNPWHSDPFHWLDSDYRLHCHSGVLHFPGWWRGHFPQQQLIKGRLWIRG